MRADAPSIINNGFVECDGPNNADGFGHSRFKQ